MNKTGIGVRLRRKEDNRFLHGRGQYIADLRFARMREVAFVRSPVAHARLTGIRIPEHLRSQVYVAKDLTGVNNIRAVSGLPGFQVSEQPPLATDKLRHVGELIAMCVADTRAQAEDIAAQVVLEYDELPAVVDMLKAIEPDSAQVHDTIKRNVFLEVGYDGPVEAAAKNAPVKVTRELRTARQVMSPIECRGFVATWEPGQQQLTLHGATQFPHVVRTGLAQVLGIPELQVRVVSADVGGGFGYKAIMAGEEICLCWLAMQLGQPVRWLEDRREQLTANANCREHHYAITAYTDQSGKFIAFDAKAAVDSGAYSAYPFTSAIEPSQVAAILPGPYDIPVYRCKSTGVVTNKCPQLPYRGVARPNVCYAMELVIDAIARQIGKEPYEVRLANLVRADQMPFDNVTDKHFDSGDYPGLLNKAVEAIDVPAVRVRQKRGEPDGRLIGLGISIFSEQTAHGTTADGKRRVFYEQTFARITPDGRLEVRNGIQAIGQGLETTLAQIASECLGVDTSNIVVKLGDTENSPYSSGAWGSRAIVWAGGSTSRACNELAKRLAVIGAAMLQTDVNSVQVRDGGVYGPHGNVSLADIARSYYLTPADLPGDIDPHGLEVTGGYAPGRLTGVHTGSAHATVVAVDPETGGVEILDYVVVEDAGVLINPMIVDGQIHGGTAQGIGAALFEEMPFDAQGQPLASTLADYLLPGSAEMPDVRVFHMETPSPYTEFGQKGVGEGGAIGPGAAVANAVNDALSKLGVEICEIPITPRRILEALAKTRPAA
ncbi:xanthine dehydrogenase family protein molybdopterin-binding subunit [Rhodoplanes sp. Z2-YC6860]|uniref:xanthine dehydrogenase family protein molybdopterin-binding subunit n=1 Tax=Rhodoplanes sp. Z2-YC6860 TaxID=674703 RepID=UPI00078DD230|nr:xanthine dehydrogenase family protein molybdopterin-binding subunit [Rhodoplanes sp. Z2-YC6860]AMN41111.1 molybdopterin binding aldehyde oxidase and xanthine dehydrogenase protein [Rhodoplanes sp. Z2-YC6860]